MYSLSFHMIFLLLIDVMAIVTFVLELINTSQISVWCNSIELSSAFCTFEFALRIEKPVSSAVSPGGDMYAIFRVQFYVYIFQSQHYVTPAEPAPCDKCFVYLRLAVLTLPLKIKHRFLSSMFSQNWAVKLYSTILPWSSKSFRRHPKDSL